MRPIDGDELYSELVKANSFGELTAKKAIRRVANAPTIDAVPVIRCKDCEWWESEDESRGYCNAAKHGHMSRNWEIDIRRTHRADFYCADAERRDE